MESSAADATNHSSAGPNAFSHYNSNNTSKSSRSLRVGHSSTPPPSFALPSSPPGASRGQYLTPAFQRRPRSSSGSSTSASAQRFIAATFGIRNRPSTSDGHTSMHHHSNSIHKYATGSSAHPSHPFQDLNPGATMPSTTSLLITDDGDEGPVCPICVEPLSHRLHGEKAHVTPICGHQLHHECFRQVYGDVTQARLRKCSLGLCGICRSDMRLDESGDCGLVRRNSKWSVSRSASDEVHLLMRYTNITEFAALTGTVALGGDTDSMLSTTLGMHGGSGTSRRSDNVQDDDLVLIPFEGHLESTVHSTRTSAGTTSSTGTVLGRRESSTAKPPPSISGGSARGFHLGQEIVQPVILVRAEHPTIVRGGQESSDKHHLTCMVTIGMPSRWPTPDPRMMCIPPGTLDEAPPLQTRSGSGLYAQPHGDGSHSRSNSGQSSMGPAERALSPPPSSIYSAFAFASTTATNRDFENQEMNEQVEDLKARMTDWKGHSLDEFGALKLFNLISVRKDANTRDFLVYLFAEAILFVNEEHRRGLAHKIVDGLSGQGDRLRLKGRVYVRHIDSVIDTSNATKYSLTVVMSDDALEEFVLTFGDRMTLEGWQKSLTALINRHKLPTSPEYHLPSAPPPAPSSGARSRAMVNSSSNESNSSTGGSAESWGTGYRSSSSSGFTRSGGTAPSTAGSCMIPEEGSASPRQRSRAQSSDYPSNISVAALSLAGPREFASLDLMLILSVPSSGPNHLKIGILRNTLDFIIQNVGPRTRIAIVTFSTGDGARGLLRKTPFLAVGKQEGRERLNSVVAELGKGRGECEALVEHQDDRVNVVTACNVALDIMLQRKAKSALTGMLLMNDGKDGAQKQQMDLVMARAEATAVPIHTIGWGRSHDPSSLWLLSNHTGGSYTFVKDFYDLREAVAGCVGGIMSIAATKVRLHISVPETRWLRIRKASGAPNAIVSSSGTDVDVDIGDLRFSERKELLIEIEMSFSGFESECEPAATGKAPPRAEAKNATDAFFLQKVGMNPSVLEAYESNNSSEGEYETMPDEIALFEVNAAYRDPAAGKNISRLHHSPTLLTVAIVNSDGPTPTSLVSKSSDPEIIRRRMELLTSDMLSRALLLVTRKNTSQARRLLEETKRIISTISGTLVNSSTPLAPGSPGGCAAAPPPGLSVKRRRSWIAATYFAETTLAACAKDVSHVLDGCEEGSDAFTQHVRYVAAQSTVVLRDQRAFTNQSATERLFFSADHAVWLAARSREWVSYSY
ncbi:BQ2448_864 [Microbotryum intermedium]|uniref:BQ2448_864 protein n=1 Tax=Microbotryum intermedium TaxID=269621 RepID=A0A238F9Q4_9BASI|nr:BQ2448_864 [Microbotryum intermedium]